MILYDLPERLLSPESDPVTMIFRNDSWVTQTTVTQLKFLGPTNTFYSLHTQNNWRLGQRHGLQNTTLTSYFSKNIYQKVIYVYFHKSIFQYKSIHQFLHFQTQQLESYSWFIFPRFDSNLVQNVNYVGYGGSTYITTFGLTDFVYVTRIPVRVSDTIRIGYVDTHFPKKHQYGDTARIINNYI